MKDYGPFALDVLYARAKAKMWAKVERLQALPDIRISDFGTRRRHSLPVAALVRRGAEGRHRRGLHRHLATCKLAMDTDLEALGTNAHELPMVLAALADERRGAARGALQGAAGLAALLWRQSADRAARRLRHRRLPARRARLGRRTGPASGPTARRRSKAARRSSPGGARRASDPQDEAADLLRRARRRHDRGDLPPFPRQGAHGLRLGHQPHQ